QKAIEHAIGEEADIAGTEDRTAQRIHAATDRRVTEADKRRECDADGTGRDRDEAAATEEGEELGKPDVAGAVVEPSGAQAGGNADWDAQLGDGSRPERIGCNALSAQRHPDKDLGTLGGNEESHRAGQSRSAMVFPREANRDANRKEKAEV